MPEHWRNDAACRASDPALFFAPEREQYSHEPPWDPGPAKEVCRSCPVRVDCLTWALEHPEERGVWGGTTDADRRRIRKDRRSRTRSCIQCGGTFQTESHLVLLCSEDCVEERHAAQQRASRIRRAS